MKPRQLACVTVTTLFVLALPTQLAAQGQTTNFRHYKLIDIGTLGGLTSYDDVNGFGVQILNNAGIVTSFGRYSHL